MNLRRLLRHLFTTELKRRRCFPAHALNVIEQEIRVSEKHHGGEIRVAIETALEGPSLWHDLSPRERAIDVFARLRVWDTEHNNGVLIYILLADQDVEIIADRGYRERISGAEWEAACRAMEAEFGAGRFETGAVKGIRAVAAIIGRRFPPSPHDTNELPDRPALL
jgi:uncharacterized membrane protein YgcG